jgi:tetratricopeptide (TPR) repeat protein
MHDKAYIMKKRLAFLFVVYSSSLIVASAQSRVIDSLSLQLKAEKEDTGKVSTLNLLSEKLWGIGKYDTSMFFAGSAIKLAEKLDFNKGIADALRNMGIIYHFQSNYPKAIEYDTIALALCKKIGYKSGIARNFGNLAIVYWNQGNYPNALDYYLKALTIDQETGDKNGIASDLGGMGNIYYEQGNYSKSLEFLIRAMDQEIKMGDKEGVSRNQTNIAVIYAQQAGSLQGQGRDAERDSLYKKALEYNTKSINICREMGNERSVAINLGNIGNIYTDLGNYPLALESMKKALEISRKIGDKEGIASNTGSIGNIYTLQKNYEQARIAFDSCLSISKEIGEKEMIQDAYSELSSLDMARGNYKDALEYYKKSILYRDSLINEANTKKTVQTEMNFEFAQKQAAEKAEQDKKDAIAEQDKNKQKVIRNSFIAGFTLMLALAFFIFRGYRQKQKANEIITRQKEEVEKQKALVEQQKVLVEEKNKDILDSITYAKRLQDAILPPLSIVKQYLPESFVMYKPKDIVAGDFYWLERVTSLSRSLSGLSQGRDFERSQPGMPSPPGEGKDEVILIAAADCTGHGVPGALVSVVCSNALNRTVKEFKITETGKILDKVRELVLETFEKSESNVQDGMDISLVALTLPSPKGEGATDATIVKSSSKATTDASLPLGRDGVKVQWSGAYNSLLYIQNSEMKELAADKQPIGRTDKPTLFTTHNITLQKGDTLYLFTDGYADQFGGEKGKKFKYAQLQQLIMENSLLPMEEQKAVLENKLQEWKGSLEQVDDILIIGVRV